MPFELHSFATWFPLPFVSTLHLVQGEMFSSAKAALVSLGLADEVDTSLRRQGSRRSTTLKRKAPGSLRFGCELPRGSRRRDEGQRLPQGPHFLLKEKIGDEFPSSPFGLIEELLCDDPWKILLGCIMLNQTRRSQVGLGTNHEGVAGSVPHDANIAHEPCRILCCCIVVEPVRRCGNLKLPHATVFTAPDAWVGANHQYLCIFCYALFHQMDPVLVRFLSKFPDAAATAVASVADVTELIRPLGLQEKRPVAIIRFSREHTRKTRSAFVGNCFTKGTDVSHSPSQGVLL